MEWLSQNWGYLLLLVGVIAFMRFGGMGCGFGGRQGRSAHGADRQGGDDVPQDAAPPIDPVSRRPVDLGSALATLYQGRPYYFESAANRERFEADPAAYAGQASEARSEHGHRHHGGGCC